MISHVLIKSYCWTLMNLSHLEISNGTKICKYYACNNKHMPNLMAMTTQIEPSRIMSLRTSKLRHNLPYRINIQSQCVRHHDAYIERNTRNECKRITIIKKVIINYHMSKWHNISKPKSSIYERFHSLVLKSMHPFEH